MIDASRTPRGSARPVVVRGQSEVSAAQSRKALKKALSDAELTPADAARQAGLATPNALYNFFNGRSGNLSMKTYEALAKAIPGATIASLRGLDRGSPTAARTIAVKAEARAGTLRDTFDLAPSEQQEAPVPIEPSVRAAGAYGVVVRRPGAELLYPEGTILVVMPMAAFDATLSTGRRVILQRIERDHVEVTVRELEVVSGKAWLWPKSAHPLHCMPVEMPWPYAPDRRWRKGDDKYSVAGVVIGAYTQEG